MPLTWRTTARSCHAVRSYTSHKHSRANDKGSKVGYMFFFYLFTGIYYLWLCIKQSAYFRMHSYQIEELKLVLPLVQLNPKAVRVASLWFPLREISFIFQNAAHQMQWTDFFSQNQHHRNCAWYNIQFMMAFTDWLISFYAVTPTVLLQWTFNSSACRLYFVTTTWLDDLHTVILGFERNYNAAK